MSALDEHDELQTLARLLADSERSSVFSTGLTELVESPDEYGNLNYLIRSTTHDGVVTRTAGPYDVRQATRIVHALMAVAVGD